MLNPKLFIFGLVLCFCSVAQAQDASGRDTDKKVPVKAVTPKPAPPVKTAVIPKPAPKPVKAAAKPNVVKKTNPVKVAVSKPVAAPVKKTQPPAPVLTVSRVTLTAVPNAQIELAGKMSGVARQDGKLVLNEVPLGVHSLKVTAEGYEPWSGLLEARTAVTDFSVSLKRRATTGTLVITVNQPGVDVFINDKLSVKSVAGRSITVEGMLPGTHQIRAVKAGFKEWRSVVKVAVAESSPVEVVMAAGISPELVRVPAGEFRMGNDNGPKDSSPAHPVSLGEFEISRRPPLAHYQVGHSAPSPLNTARMVNNKILRSSASD